MTRNETLGGRLVAASTAWILATLLVAGLVLVLLFRDHIERRFDAALHDHMEELIAASDVGADGSLGLSWRPLDPRFNRPRSGWYWQIRRDDRIVERSESMWGGELSFPPMQRTRAHVAEIPGPGGEALRGVEQAITLPRSDGAYLYSVAGPVADVDRDVRHFTMQIALTLALLAAGLVAAVVFQVRFGLRPLHRLRMALSGVRSGQTEELQGRFPGEVQPLVEELNALLARNAAMLERARAQAADLAHALKNPLTVIKNEARTLHGPAGEILRKEAAAMAAAIDRHLSRARARAAGARAHPAQRTPVDAVVDDLRYSLERLHRDRGLTMDLSGDAGQIFAGEREDLEEMLGNLMDNACKWARQRVQVRVKAGPGRLCIQVEDDGPGVPPARFDEVLERGRRLDETTPGTGMGLAIVRDLAEAYGGAIALSPSPLGGLCASLTLPAHSGQGRGTAGPE